MALLAELHYNFITLVYFVSKNITDATICVCRYSLKLKALSSGSLFLKANHRYYHQIQSQLHITGHSQCDMVVWTTADLQVIHMTKDILWTQNISKLIDDERRLAAGGNRGLVRRGQAKSRCHATRADEREGNPATAACFIILTRVPF